MIKLLKADFYHIFKSKLTLIALILIPVLPLLASLLFFGLALLLFSNDTPIQAVRTVFEAKMLISNSYSTSGSVGLVLPIFSGIFICADLNNGTLRNKIIVGNSRTIIYFSHLITSIIFNVILVSIYAGFTVLFSTAFFNYGPEIDTEEIKTIIYFFVYGTLLFIYLATLTCMIAMVFKSMPITIIFTILLAMGFSLFATILVSFDIEKIRAFAYFLPCYPIPYFMYGNTITNELFLKSSSSVALLSILNTVLGLLSFNHTDLK